MYVSLNSLTNYYNIQTSSHYIQTKGSLLFAIIYGIYIPFNGALFSIHVKQIGTEDTFLVNNKQNVLN